MSICVPAIPVSRAAMVGSVAFAAISSDAALRALRRLVGEAAHRHNEYKKGKQRIIAH